MASHAPYSHDGPQAYGPWHDARFSLAHPIPMWLEAILTRDDLLKLAAQFAPLLIQLGDGGELSFDTPTELTFVPDVGIELVCAGKLKWPVLGVDVPVTMHALRVRVRPAVEEREKHEGGAALVFKVELLHVDVAHLPTVLDNRVTERINEELTKRHAELAWGFGATLSHVFPLPDALASASALRLSVAAGKVKVTDQALGFAVSFQTTVDHETAGRAPKTTLAAEAPRSTALNDGQSPALPPATDGHVGADSDGEVPVSVRAHLARARRAPSGGLALTTLAARGAATALAVAATFALGRLSVRRTAGHALHHALKSALRNARRSALQTNGWTR